jgi:Tfp pilus assembly protein PilV
MEMKNQGRFVFLRVIGKTCSLKGNSKGISLVEALIALFLLSFGVLSLLTLQPSAWRLSGKSDYLTRAAGLMQRQIQASEAYIMNPGTVVSPGTITVTNVPVSGEATPQLGDAAFTVKTTTATAPDIGANTWRVSVTVTWPGRPTGISTALIVTKQQYFR